ncbi:MAG: hypothetical protein CM1200mP10_09990 [Candidatus Neomarinimicrobiota bacterium]|nr:MAG: hypothetical protein CM1200mP10_09990 [Candidatus Neomarinimicrobiota bacterium]
MMIIQSNPCLHILNFMAIVIIKFILIMMGKIGFEDGDDTWSARFVMMAMETVLQHICLEKGENR